MLRRFLRHAIVLVYLSLSLGAVVFTISKIHFLPAWATRWSYGMMAPYQTDTSWNMDIVYEGERADGSIHKIDLGPYMPYGFGERNQRGFLVHFAQTGTGAFAARAFQLLDHERDRGNAYRSISVYREQWDRSPAGYEFLHIPPFTTRTFITRVQ